MGVVIVWKSAIFSVVLGGRAISGAGRPGKAPTADQVIEFCRGRPAGFKKPRTVEFVDVLPKNSLGKAMKAELRRSFGSAFARER